MLRPASHATRPGELVDRLIDLAIMAGLVVLILVGFTTSYRTLLDLAVTAGGYPRWLAPAVPLSFDLGVVVLSLKVARSAREGRTAPVMRLLVVALSAATVLANASAASALPAKLLHAVPPAMFVVCFESVIVTARRRALAQRGLLPGPVPRMRTLQWLLAPASTWQLWRARVLAQPEVLPERLPAEVVGEVTVGELEPAPKPAVMPGPSTPVADRGDVVRELVSVNPGLSAPEIQRALADRGHTASLRTVQRLVAAVRRDPSVGTGVVQLRRPAGLGD